MGIKDKKQTIHSLLEWARRAIDSSHFSEARTLLEKIEEKDSGNEEAMELLWQIENEQPEKFGEDLSELEELTFVPPSQIKTLRSQIRQLLDQHRTSDARWALEQAQSVSDVSELSELIAWVKKAENRDERLRQRVTRIRSLLAEGQFERAKSQLPKPDSKDGRHPAVLGLRNQLDNVLCTFAKEVDSVLEEPPSATTIPAAPLMEPSAPPKELLPPHVTEDRLQRPERSPTYSDPVAQAQAEETSRLHPETPSPFVRPAILPQPQTSPQTPTSFETSMIPSHSHSSPETPLTLTPADRTPEPKEAPQKAFPSSPSARPPVASINITQPNRKARRALSALALLTLAGFGGFKIWQEMETRRQPPEIDKVFITFDTPQPLGCRKEDDLCSEDEPQAFNVALPPFQMAKTEVSQDLFARCVRAGQCSDEAGPIQKAPDHPMTHVTWNEAQEFCHWVGGRLPNEMEWESVARNAPPNKDTQVQIFNHGASICCSEDGSDGWTGTGPVTQVGTDSRGIIGLAGNVAEWTLSEYQKGALNESSNFPARGHSPKAVVLRGGSFLHPPEMLRPTARQAMAPDIRSQTIGFRCVWPD